VGRTRSEGKRVRPIISFSPCLPLADGGCDSRLLAIAQVGDDDNSAEHGNGDTVAEILADADGNVHNHLPPIPR